MDGRWDTPDLTQLLTVLAANQPALERAFYGRWWTRALLRLKHLLQREHQAPGAAQHPRALRPRQRVLRAVARSDDDLLVGALRRRLRARRWPMRSRRSTTALLGELALPPGARVLEIGCGWGGFAETAARAGHRVTGISLSDAQTAYARERLARRGLADRVDLRAAGLSRRATARSTASRRSRCSRRSASATGRPTSARCATRWRPAAAPASRRSPSPTTASSATARSRTSSSSTSFPGGMLASPARFAGRRAGRRARGSTRVHAFGRDYAETLKRWLAAFDAAMPAIRALGFDERSSAAGASTSPTAPPASTRGPPMSRSTRSSRA